MTADSETASLMVDPEAVGAPAADANRADPVSELAELLDGLVSSRLRIDAVRIQSFKRIVDTRIELGPITYLVGGNNSGKSSVLQAIHTAVSCAQASVELGQQVVAEASLRYSPVADFSLLGHGAPYENRSGGQRGIVDFEGVPADSSVESAYRIEMYKARNHNNVGVDRSGMYTGFGQAICDPKTLFSVYVPGLAGVPHREEMSGYAAVFRKAASGDANLVFRNIIRLLAERSLLKELESLLESVLKVPVSFRVDFNSDRDLYVDVRLATGVDPGPRDHLPVDLWGTGLLQITQIFAYVLLFKPSLLLVDEPDSHLHPSRQKSLGVALEQVSDRFKCKVVVSTHSRHLITGASDAVKVVWMKDGRVESDSQKELTALLMDLGALDQLDNSTRTILCTEDEDPWALRLALSSTGMSEDAVKITSFNGLNNAFTAEAFREMAELMHSAPRVVIHRDRDFLTDDELAEWSRTFSDRDIDTFCPTRSDTEAYHATAAHIAAVTGMSLDDATTLRNEVIEMNLVALRNHHREKRRYANKKYLDGGAPRTEDLWPEDVMPSEDVLYGKKLLTQVEKTLHDRGLLARSDSLTAHPSDELRAELIAALGELVMSPSSTAG
ncbi:ATP-dependent nuclease [Arthrobacter bambusae]|uniref:ABC-type branched-subunit amino acid transport system ATPase component n=1 Tax=Arthrobacter bambusae TaxID=1338426 RepID=A0AAW8D9Y8_9MICC|nr:AAA family ATPase [Arthrobacter bambusae]MDP9903298.1 ABC-type branched-subunit amino acid transport system ATPase component [Arthrobacter bambusae]MDQ0128708.1 ABC-type branched-subunit amino acid transport system ATPase component [Arthrobacter bambusae]MDQ0180049.1 ABC-type branched-subunit amino acid transport system ATPase component [Arthrobacter bambusae]